MSYTKKSKYLLNFNKNSIKEIRKINHNNISFILFFYSRNQW